MIYSDADDASPGSTGASAAAAGPGSTRAGGSSQFIPALTAALVKEDPILTKKMRQDIFQEYSHKPNDWQGLNDKINKLISHRRRWDSDEPWRKDKAKNSRTRISTTAVGVGDWADAHFDRCAGQA